MSTTIKTLCLVSLFFILLCGFSSQKKQFKKVVYKKLEENTTLYLKTLKVFNSEDSPKPCAIFLSGGGWEDFSWTQHNKLAQAFANIGIQPIVVEYRTANNFKGVTPFDALEDVKDAIAFIRKKATSLKIDPNNIIAIGTSAGGNLAFGSYLTGTAEQNNRPNYIVGISPVIRNDNKGYAFKKIGENYTWFSPYNVYMETEARLAPSFIISGELDPLIHFQDLIDFKEKAKEKKDILTLKKVAGVKHSMIKQVPDIYEQIFKLVLPFLEENQIPYNKQVLESVDFSTPESEDFFLKPYVLKKTNKPMKPWYFIILIVGIIMFIFIKKRYSKFSLVVLIGTMICVGCNDSKISVKTTKGYISKVTTYTDDFENDLGDFWSIQAVDESRYKISKDPLNPKNRVLEIHLENEDFVAGGHRTEFVLSPKDSFGYKNVYSFKFLLPPSFFKKEDKGWTMIHQWHDEPPMGYTWKTNKHKTRPPVSLIITNDDEGEKVLNFCAGLVTGNKRDNVVISWPEKLKPNNWYTFSCEIFWSLYDGEGYAIPQLNGIDFTDFANLSEFIVSNKIKRANMYNVLPNYFKFGLYHAGNKNNSKTIYFDDFKMETGRIADKVLN